MASKQNVEPERIVEKEHHIQDEEPAAEAA